MGCLKSEAAFIALKSGQCLNVPFSMNQTIRHRKWNYRAKPVFLRNALYKFRKYMVFSSKIKIYPIIENQSVPNCHDKTVALRS